MNGVRPGQQAFSTEIPTTAVDPAHSFGPAADDASLSAMAAGDRITSTSQYRDAEIASDIARALLDDHERIASQIVAAVDREVRAYADAAEARLVLADVRAHCDAHVRAFLSSLRSPPEELDLAFVEEAIMRRVGQGIPLEAILHSFRIGHQVFWTAVIDCASAIPGGRSAAILMVQPSIRYIDSVSTRVAEMYLREQQRALADADRIRRDVLELLLAGSPQAVPAAAAAGIELDARGPHHLLAASMRPSADSYALRLLAEEIATAFAPWAVLVVTRHDMVIALLRGGGSAAVDAARHVIGRYRDIPGRSPRIGISLPAGNLGGLGRAHEEAGSALRVASESTPIIALGQMPALDYLVAGADHIARSLVPSAVRALALSARKADVALVQTLGAYLASGLNVQQTAAALPAHPNTVHGRLRRLSDRTGYDLRDVEALMRLATELRLAAAH